MKKCLLFVLTGALLFVLVSCGTKESKQFKASKLALEAVQQKLESVTNCEDLNMLGLDLLLIGIDDSNYAEDEKMTVEEMTKFEEMVDDFSKKADAKSAELGCNKNVEDEVDMIMDSVNDVATDLVDSIFGQ